LSEPLVKEAIELFEGRIVDVENYRQYKRWRRTCLRRCWAILCERRKSCRQRCRDCSRGKDQDSGSHCGWRNGHGGGKRGRELISIKIERDVVNADDVEMLQDLILAAANEALRRAQQMVNEEMAKLTGGLQIPGLEGWEIYSDDTGHYRESYQ